MWEPGAAPRGGPDACGVPTLRGAPTAGGVGARGLWDARSTWGCPWCAWGARWVWGGRAVGCLWCIGESRDVLGVPVGFGGPTPCSLRSLARVPGQLRPTALPTAEAHRCLDWVTPWQSHTGAQRGAKRQDGIPLGGSVGLPCARCPSHPARKALVAPLGAGPGGGEGLLSMLHPPVVLPPCTALLGRDGQRPAQRPPCSFHA